MQAKRGAAGMGTWGAAKNAASTPQCMTLIFDQ